MTTTTTIVNTRPPPGVRPLRMKTPYWEGLDGPTKTSCVGRILPQSYRGKAAWEAAGCLLEYWEKQLNNSVKSALKANEQQKVYIKDDQHAAVLVSFRLCLLGPVGTPAKSKPSVLVVCENPRIASRTVDLLKKHPEIKKLNLGFGFVAHTERIIILAGALESGLASVLQDTTFTTTCGSRIISAPVPVHRESEGKRSTLGGVLLLGGHYYGLTVAHTLLQEFGYDDSGNNSSEDARSFSEQSSDDGNIVNEDTLPAPIGVTYSSTMSAVYLENQNHLNADPRSVIRESFDSQDSASSISLVGHTDATFEETGNAESNPGSRWFSLDSDWALIEIQDSRLMLPNVFVVNGVTYTVRSFCTKENRPEGELVVLTGGKETVHVPVPGALAGISLPWSREFVDVWIMEFPSARGDCGTWVVDAQSGSFFGVVVASSADSKSTYVLPAEDIIDSIYAKWKDRVTSSSDMFPTVAASADRIRTFELPPYDDFSILEGERVITGLHLPARGDFRNFEDNYKQFDGADSESTRSYSAPPSEVFDRPLQGRYVPSMSSSLSHAQSARYGGQSNQDIGRSVPVETVELPILGKLSHKDSEREKNINLIKQQDAELQKGRATIKKREAELEEQKIANRQQVEKLQQEIRRLKETTTQQQSMNQNRHEIPAPSQKDTRLEAVPDGQRLGTRFPSEPRHQSTAQRTSSAAIEREKSRLSLLARGFAQIGRGQFLDCLSYTNLHPTVLAESPEEFLREAVSALQLDDTAYAKQCVERAMIVRKSEDRTGRQLHSYLTALTNKSHPAASNFEADFESSFSSLKERFRYMIDIDNLSRSELGRSVFEPHGVLNAPPLHSRSAPHSQGGRRYAASEPVDYGQPPSPEKLDERFNFRSGANDFFTVGRVFAMLWHVNIGGSARPNQQDLSAERRSTMVLTGRFGELIMTYIQRMAVVKQGHGFCWCIPVNTYNGKGVAKKGFNASDRAAHAIIYMKHQSPYQADDEHDISKRAIMVIPAGDDQKLDPMSRLHFGKVHTVEHNVKVMNVGRVDAGSLPYFEGYWEGSAKQSFRQK